MEKHRCKICSRRFSNGKAMGGHMRSHLAKLPIPPKIPYQATTHEQLTESTLINPSSSSSHAKQQHKSLTFTNFKSIYSDPSTVHDRESESESSPKNPTRKRSSRTRKFTIESSPAAEPELTVSSVSEEDVAMSLIMLSRDKWVKNGKVVVVKDETETEENSTENEDEDEDEEEDDDDKVFNAPKRPCRAIYKCETCKKVFKSYQALGGHRASHKKIRTRFQDDDPQTEWSIDGGDSNGGYDHNNGDYTNRRIFECPFCYKVFDSGQALGGHKKVHFSNNNAAAFSSANARTKSSTTTSSAKVRDNWIDLNLPAPEEDEDSTVSNAEVFLQFK